MTSNRTEDGSIHVVVFTDRARDIVIKALDEAGEDFYVPIKGHPDYMAIMKRVEEENPGMSIDDLLRAILQELRPQS
jgi:hypothetical protein